jgi:tetratricopeptide (TPR) repeat protein
MTKREILAILPALFAATGLYGQGGDAPLPDSLKFAESYAPELRPTVYYTEGVARAAQERPTEALDWFALALALDPDHAPSLYETANALASMGDAAKALEFSRRAAEIEPENEWYRAQKARLLVSTGQLEEALPLYESMLGRQTMFEPDNYRILSIIYYQLGQSDKALSTLDSAEVRLGRTPELVDLKRGILLDGGKVDEAVKLTKEYIADTPYDETNRLFLADLYGHLGQDSLRVATLKEVIDINPDNVDALTALADSYYTRNNATLFFATVRQIFLLNEVPLKDKIDYFQTLTRNWNFSRGHFAEMSDLALVLVTRYSGNADAVELYAGHLIRSGNIEGAARVLKTLLSGETPPLTAFMQIIEVEAHLGRTDSVSHYNALALQHFPNDVDLYLQKSWIEQTGGNFKAAHTTLKQALAVAETDEARSIVTGAIGTLWHEQGNAKKSFKEYDKALSYNPDNDNVLNNYAYYLAEQGVNLEKAFEMASRATALVENSATYLDTYAWVLYKLGRFAEARGVMKRALPLDGSGNPELLVHYGDILYALGENFLASDYWKRAREAGYDETLIKERLSKLGGQK